MTDLQARLKKAINDKNLDDVCMVLDLLRDSGTHVDEGTYTDLIKMGAQQGHTGLISRLPADLLDMPLGDLDESAVHIAAGHNQDKAVARLVELGADAARPDVDGITPGVWAAEKGHWEATRTLLDLLGRTKDVDTLCAAARSGHKDLVGDLLDHAHKNDDPYTTTERNSALAACPRSLRSELERFIKSVEMGQNIMSAMGGDDPDTAASSNVPMDMSGVL